MASPLFILRHGETEWNRIGRMQGRLDSALTPLGEAQSAAMGQLLAGLGQPAPGMPIWSSPQGRALATARIAFGADAAIRTHAELGEIDMGDWTGLTREEIALGWPGPEDETLSGFYDRAPGGEGIVKLWERAGRVLAAIGTSAIVVTHGMTGRALRLRAIGLGPERMDDLPGGQGVVWRVTDERHEVLEATLSA